MVALTSFGMMVGHTNELLLLGFENDNLLKEHCTASTVFNCPTLLVYQPQNIHTPNHHKCYFACGTKHLMEIIDYYCARVAEISSTLDG